jgi:hypothetical protein
MCPITHTSYLELIVITIASFIFGFLWYGPLFGKTWMQLMGKKMEDCQGKKPPVSSMLLTLLGTFLTVWVLAFVLHRPENPCGALVALFAWMGYQIPILLGSVTWEDKPWKLFALNAAFYLLNLQLIATILTYWR